MYHFYLEKNPVSIEPFIWY